MTATLCVVLIGIGSAVALCVALAGSAHYINTGRRFR